jgi:hypothetical protein
MFTDPVLALTLGAHFYPSQRLEVWFKANRVVHGAYSTQNSPNLLMASLAGSAVVAVSDASVNIPITPVNALLLNSNFDGELALQLVNRGNGRVIDNIDIETAVLTATVVPSFTGLEGPVHAEGRADYCPKCGQYSTRDLWVRDGYLRIMVCQGCYDPPDEVGKVKLATERKPAGED